MYLITIVTQACIETFAAMDILTPRGLKAKCSGSLMYLFTKLMAPFSYTQYLIINLHIMAIAGRRLSNWKKTLKVVFKRYSQISKVRCRNLAFNVGVAI